MQYLIVFLFLASSFLVLAQHGRGRNLSQMSAEEIRQQKYLDSLRKVRDEFSANFSTEEYFKRLRAIKLKNDSIQLNETLEYFKEIEPRAETMESLSIQSSALAVFPPSIKRFKKLRALTLRRCPTVGLETLFDQIKDLVELETLNIIFSDRAQLPDNIGDLRYVKHLNLNGNDLNTLPDGMANMASLESINLHNNPRLNMGNVIDILSQVRSLRDVQLSGCKISELPSIIGNLNQIHSLDLNTNLLISVPSSLSRMTNLKSLDVSRNSKLNAEQIFTNIGYAPSLESLIMNDCNLSSIPSSIATLSNLKILDVSNNPIQNVSPAIGKLSELEELRIGTETLLKRKVPLKKLPYDISNCKNLRVLDLKLCDLVKLPTGFSNLEHLEHLDMSWNALTQFPEEILNLTKLKYLNLSFNKINRFPDELGAITESLETLLLEANFYGPYQSKINKIPESITSLKNLKTLSLQDQVFEYLPDNFWSNLTKLEDLNLRGALLQEVPSGVQDLKYLKNLNLKANEIKKLNKSIIRLDKLESLNISFNPKLNTAELLETLKLIPNLKYLDISFNNIFRRQDRKSVV